MKTRHQQQGFLALVAVFLILIVGLLGVVMAYMVGGNALGVANFAHGDEALYVAQAGFEEAARLLYTPNLSGSNSRIGCSSMTGNANVTNTSFGTGTFTATMVSGSPYYVNSTLSSAITASSASIPVASTTGFASAGRIMVDNELINYGGISGNSFVGVQRGVNYTYATPHASGAYVSQYQCNLDVIGGVPSVASPTYKRDIQQSVTLQEAWVVGSKSGSNFVLDHWNRPTEVSWTDASFSNANAVNLNDISLLSNAEGWAVGDVISNKLSFIHLTGSNWSSSTIASACAGQNLLGVSSVYSNEAWAVGVICSNRYTVAKWNGTTWTLLSPSSSPSIPADSGSNVTLNAVHVIDTTQSGAGTLGFAVGNSGVILKYNGSSWTAMTSPTNKNLFGVFVVSSSEAWAVGANGTIIKYNGTSWSTVTSPTNTQLNAIFMQDSNLSGTANSGWAVGNSGVAVSYNGSSWASNNTGASQNMTGVAMFANTQTQDVWAVGAAGKIYHYNGSAWSSITSNETVNLQGISVIAPQQYPFAWQEIYP